MTNDYRVLTNHFPVGCDLSYQFSPWTKIKLTLLSEKKSELENGSGVAFNGRTGNKLTAAEKDLAAVI